MKCSACQGSRGNLSFDMRTSYSEISLTDPPAETLTVIGVAPGATVDKHFTYSFTNESTITVDHNLGKRPSTFIVDSAGDEVEGEVNHVSNSQLVVSFTASFTGTIICN